MCLGSSLRPTIGVGAVLVNEAVLPSSPCTELDGKALYRGSHGVCSRTRRGQQASTPALRGRPRARHPNAL